jgi:hypothetical protein
VSSGVLLGDFLLFRGCCHFLVVTQLRGMWRRNLRNRMLEIPGSSGLADQYGLFFEESGQKTFLRC